MTTKLYDSDGRELTIEELHVLVHRTVEAERLAKEDDFIANLSRFIDGADRPVSRRDCLFIINAVRNHNSG